MTAAHRPSVDRQTVLQAALGSERVLSALDLEPRALADLVLKTLAVMPNVLDGSTDSVVRQPDGRPELAFHVEQEPGLGIWHSTCT